MIIPVFIAYAAYKEIDEATLEKRLSTILEFLHLDDQEEFVVHQLADKRAGLIFIERRQSRLRVPLLYKTNQRMTISAYTPFGAGRFVTREQLSSGQYLPQIQDLLRVQPHMLQQLAPPLIWCDLDLQRERLTLVNDYRGFGRLYQYTTSFGTIWTNKMAAALLLAGIPARLDECAWAEMAATGMFFGASTGYANMAYTAPGSLITVELQSGLTEYRRLSTDCGGITMAPNPQHAAAEAHEALQEWTRELKTFYTDTPQLSLSGGRDSRVVAAHLLAEGAVQPDILTVHPPRKDAELAQQLIERLDTPHKLTICNRKDEIVDRYSDTAELVSYAQSLLSVSNLDMSVASAFSAGDHARYQQPSLFIGGAQGETAHNCFYTAEMVAALRRWENKPEGENPADKRLRTFLGNFTSRSWGLNQNSQKEAHDRLIRQTLEPAYMEGINGFYALDYLCLRLHVNRQWAGANGNEEMKSPLTVYPYVRYGFAQTLESKLNSRFIRDVIALAQPQWKNIPFFHELPQENQQDFITAYPTYWEMGRGEELQELCNSTPDLWLYFDKDLVSTTFARLHAARGKAEGITDKLSSQCNRVAQRMLWYTAAVRQLRAINSLILAQ